MTGCCIYIDGLIASTPKLLKKSYHFYVINARDKTADTHYVIVSEKNYKPVTKGQEVSITGRLEYHGKDKKPVVRKATMEVGRCKEK